MNPLVTEARALCRDATDGPWHAGRADMGTFVDGYESKWIYAGEPAEKSKYLAVSSGYEIKEWDEVMANAHLIARSRTLIPEMAAEIDRLESKAQFLTEAYDRNAKVHEALTRDYLAVKSERDRFKARAEAAEKDIKQMLQGDELEGLCVFCRCYGNMGSVCCKDAEWRGPQEGANE